MEISFVIGFVVMWVGLLLARSVSNKEMRLLDNEMKAKLIDLATQRRSMQIAIMVAGIAAFYVISLLIDCNREIWFGIYALFIIGWIIYLMNASLKKYKELGFSDVFIRSQLNAGLIRLAGIVIFFAVFTVNFMLKK